MTARRRTFGSKHSKESGPSFVQMFHWVMQCPAWRDLGPNGQAVYIALKRRYNGSNNGHIGFGCREAAEAIGMSYATASRALQDLVAHGFIVEVTKGVVGGGSGYNLATEWLLTECYDNLLGRPATKLFMTWTKTGTTVAKSGPSVSPAKRNGNLVPHKESPRLTGATQVRKPGQDTLHGRNTLTSSHTLGTRTETRGAAGPHERSKPRVARTGTPAASMTPAFSAEKPPADFARSDPSIDDRKGNSREPIPISEALLEVLKGARGNNSSSVASGVRRDRTDA